MTSSKWDPSRSIITKGNLFPIGRFSTFGQVFVRFEAPKKEAAH